MPHSSPQPDDPENSAAPNSTAPPSGDAGNPHDAETAAEAHDDEFSAPIDPVIAEPAPEPTLIPILTPSSEASEETEEEAGLLRSLTDTLVSSWHSSAEEEAAQDWHEYDAEAVIEAQEESSWEDPPETASFQPVPETEPFIPIQSFSPAADPATTPVPEQSPPSGTRAGYAGPPPRRPARLPQGHPPGLPRDPADADPGPADRHPL